MISDNSQNSINSLILLFVFDKMDIPLTENTIIEMVCSLNNWISYMDCKHSMGVLLDKKWICKLQNNSNVPKSEGETYFTITVDGRICLSHLYTTIPAQTRVDIADFVNEKRMHFRRKQEYYSDYYVNEDGSYTTLLRIVDATRPILELSLCVPDRATASTIYKKWESKAAEFYALINDILIE